MKITFCYVRHGQTLFNKLRRVQGSCDSPLTAQGIADAEKAAHALKDVPFTKAFCSSSERARDTAEIVLKPHHLEAVPMKLLKEFDFGIMDGSLLMDPLAAEEFERRRKAGFRDLGGDDKASILERIRKAFGIIVSHCQDGDVVLVAGHGAFGLYLLEALFGMDSEAYREEVTKTRPGFAIPNGGIIPFVYEEGTYRILHLPMTPEEFDAAGGAVLSL